MEFVSGISNPQATRIGSRYKSEMYDARLLWTPAIYRINSVGHELGSEQNTSKMVRGRRERRSILASWQERGKEECLPDIAELCVYSSSSLIPRGRFSGMANVDICRGPFENDQAVYSQIARRTPREVHILRAALNRNLETQGTLGGCLPMQVLLRSATFGVLTSD